MRLVTGFNEASSFLWNTKNTDKNGVIDKTNTHLREKGLLLVHDNPVLRTTLYFTNTHPLFGEILKTKLTLFIKKEFQLWYPYSPPEIPEN